MAFVAYEKENAGNNGVDVSESLIVMHCFVRFQYKSRMLGKNSYFDMKLHLMHSNTTTYGGRNTFLGQEYIPYQ